MRTIHLAPLAALLLGTAPAFAQQAPTRPEGYKDPGTAQLIGLLAPGAGQIWIGGDKTKKGLTLLAVGYGAPILGLVTTAGSGNFAPYALGFGVLIGTAVYGIVTAPADAKEHNQQLTKTIALLQHVQPIVAPMQEGIATRTALGMSLRF